MVSRLGSIFLIYARQDLNRQGGHYFVRMPSGVYERKKGYKKPKRKRGYKRPPFSEEWKRNMSESHKGYVPTEETRRKISKAMMGNKHCLGNRHTEAAKRKMSEARKRNPVRHWAGKRLPWQAGAGNYFWRGGVSFGPYSTTWTKALRDSIRDRDHHTCQLCGKLQDDGRGTHVHHIDYDKKNCGLDNLITLCRVCHAKTGCDRERWELELKRL